MDVLAQLHLEVGKDLPSTIASLNPSTGSVIAYAPVTTMAEYHETVQRSQAAFQTWRDVPAPKRGEVVRAIADTLRAHKDALGSLVSMETGKIKAEGDGEVQEMIDIADFAVGLSRMLYGKTMHSERPHHRMYEQWHPLGPIGVITAFNFPVAVWAWNALIALVCGDTVIWKPSPKAPLTALAVHKLCQQVMRDFGYVDVLRLVISDDLELANAMVEDTRLPLISFTGSTAVGRIVGQKVAARLGRSLLELSGNNAVIVAEDADFSKAVPSIVFGAVGTAGQRCTSTRRVLVARSRLDELADQLKAAYSQVRVGDPLSPETLMGPLIDQTAVDAYSQAIKEIKNLGGALIHGGQLVPREGFYVSPTLVLAEPDWPVVAKETFAPILYLLPFDDLDEAIALHNQTAHGLSSALFTESVKTAERFLSVLGSDCGIANINIGTSGAEIGGAFGGEKDTGGGREAGSDAWKAYMRRQTNTINWSDELPLAQGIAFRLR